MGRAESFGILPSESAEFDHELAEFRNTLDLIDPEQRQKVAEREDWDAQAVFGLRDQLKLDKAARRRVQGIPAYPYRITDSQFLEQERRGIVSRYLPELDFEYDSAWYTVAERGLSADDIEERLTIALEAGVVLKETRDSVLRIRPKTVAEFLAAAEALMTNDTQVLSTRSSPNSAETLHVPTFPRIRYMVCTSPHDQVECELLGVEKGEPVSLKHDPDGESFKRTYKPNDPYHGSLALMRKLV